MLVKHCLDLDSEGFKPEELVLEDDPEYSKCLKEIKNIFINAEGLKDFQYRDYQLQAAAAYCLQRRNLAGLSQGLGKTLISALMIAKLYPDLLKEFSNRGGRIHIAIGNSTGASRWLAELALLFPKSSVAYLTKFSDVEKFGKDAPIWVYTHDFLKLKGNSRTRPCIAKAIIKEHRPSFLIIDEVHNLGNPGSSRYRHLDWMSRKAKRVLGLSGTVTEGQLNSLDGILSLIYQADWTYFRRPAKFAKLLGEDKPLNLDYQTGQVETNSTKKLQSVPFSKLPDYYSLMRQFIHRISIDEPSVKKDIILPELIVRKYQVSMAPAQFLQYKKYVESFKSQIDLAAQSTSGSAAARKKVESILYNLISICNYQEYMLLGNGVPGRNVKVKKLVELVKDFNKTAVFCQYVNSSRYSTAVLRDEFGYESITRLYAHDDFAYPKKMSVSERWNAIERFETDSSVKAGVFSLNLASEAIDLLAADHIVFYCLPWSVTKLDQALRRCLRPGNKNAKLTVSYITHDWGIDTYQLQLLEAKKCIAKLLLDYETGVELSNSSSEIDFAQLSGQVLDVLNSLGS